MGQDAVCTMNNIAANKYVPIFILFYKYWILYNLFYILEKYNLDKLFEVAFSQYLEVLEYTFSYNNWIEYIFAKT